MKKQKQKQKTGVPFCSHSKKEDVRHSMKRPRYIFARKDSHTFDTLQENEYRNKSINQPFQSHARRLLDPFLQELSCSPLTAPMANSDQRDGFFDKLQWFSQVCREELKCCRF